MKTKNSRGLNAYSPFWAMKKKQQSHLIILAHGSPMGYHNPWPSSVITNHLLYINFPHGFGAEIPIKRAPWLRGPVVNRREATLCNSPSNTAGGTWRGNATFVSGNGLYITISTKSFFWVLLYNHYNTHIIFMQTDLPCLPVAASPPLRSQADCVPSQDVEVARPRRGRICDQNWEPDSRNLYVCMWDCNYAYIYILYVFAYIVKLS